MPFPKIEIPKINLPSFNGPSNSAINTTLIMEAVAPGTGIITGALVDQKPSFFENIGNSFSNLFSGIGKGGSGVGGSGKNGQLQIPTDPNQKPDYTFYYVLGAVVLIIVVVMVVRANKK